MKLFLMIAAVLAWLFSAALLIVPGGFYAPTGIVLTPMLATIAQAHGATLFGLGVVTWLARNADHKGQMAVCGGSFVVQILSLGVVLRTMQLGAGLAVAPGVVLHLVLGTAFAVFYLRAKRT